MFSRKPSTLSNRLNVFRNSTEEVQNQTKTPETSIKVDVKQFTDLREILNNRRKQNKENPAKHHIQTDRERFYNSRNQEEIVRGEKILNSKRRDHSAQIQHPLERRIHENSKVSTLDLKRPSNESRNPLYDPRHHIEKSSRQLRMDKIERSENSKICQETNKEMPIKQRERKPIRIRNVANCLSDLVKHQVVSAVESNRKKEEKISSLSQSKNDLVASSEKRSLKDSEQQQVVKSHEKYQNIKNSSSLKEEIVQNPSNFTTSTNSTIETPSSSFATCLENLSDISENSTTSSASSFTDLTSQLRQILKKDSNNAKSWLEMMENDEKSENDGCEEMKIAENLEKRIKKKEKVSVRKKPNLNLEIKVQTLITKTDDLSSKSEGISSKVERSSVEVQNTSPVPTKSLSSPGNSVESISSNQTQTPVILSPLNNSSSTSISDSTKHPNNSSTINKSASSSSVKSSSSSQNESQKSVTFGVRNLQSRLNRLQGRSENPQRNTSESEGSTNGSSKLGASKNDFQAGNFHSRTSSFSSGNSRSHTNSECSSTEIFYENSLKIPITQFNGGHFQETPWIYNQTLENPMIYHEPAEMTNFQFYQQFPPPQIVSPIENFSNQIFEVPQSLTHQTPAIPHQSSKIDSQQYLERFYQDPLLTDSHMLTTFHFDHHSLDLSPELPSEFEMTMRSNEQRKELSKDQETNLIYVAATNKKYREEALDYFFEYYKEIGQSINYEEVGKILKARGVNYEVKN